MRGAGFSQTRKHDQSCVLSKGEFSAADSLQDIKISKIQDDVNFRTLFSSNRPISPSNLTIGLMCPNDPTPSWSKTSTVITTGPAVK